MKKEYMKPVAQMEQFTLDMQFASNTSTDWYQMLVHAWDEKHCDMNGDGQEDEADWEVFVALEGYDNSTSGFCYHTNVRPS